MSPPTTDCHSYMMRNLRRAYRKPKPRPTKKQLTRIEEKDPDAKIIKNNRNQKLHEKKAA